MEQEDRLKPPHASPMPLKQRGLRRAKTLLCQWRFLRRAWLPRAMCDTDSAWDSVVAALGSEEPEHGRCGL